MLRDLQFGGNDLGPTGAAAIAEVLKSGTAALSSSWLQSFARVKFVSLCLA